MLPFLWVRDLTTEPATDTLGVRGNLVAKELQGVIEIERK